MRLLNHVPLASVCLLEASIQCQFVVSLTLVLLFFSLILFYTCSLVLFSYFVWKRILNAVA